MCESCPRYQNPPYVFEVFRLHENVALALEEFGIVYELLNIDPDFADDASFCVKDNYPQEYSCNTIIVASEIEI